MIVNLLSPVTLVPKTEQPVLIKAPRSTNPNAYQLGNNPEPNTALPFPTGIFKDFSETSYAQLLTPASTPDPKAALFEEIKGIFNNDTVYNEWKAFAESKNIDANKLQQFKKALTDLKTQLGGDRFEKMLGEPYRGQDNIYHNSDAMKRLAPGKPNEDAGGFYGVILDDNSTVDKWINAVWTRGDEYGEGKIGAPYVACSALERLDSNHVHQQIVLDIPFPFGNKMTLNDSYKRPYAGLGSEVSWKLIKDEEKPWACLNDKKGTTMNVNVGLWRFIPIGPNKLIVWYATQSEVEGADPTDGQAVDALKDNVEAFYKAAH